MNCPNEIGKNIRLCRKTAHLTQKELAEKIGTSHAAISFWENGVNIPNVADCIKMSDVMKISIDELVGHNIVN